MNRVSRLVPELSSEECRTLLAPPLAGSPAEVGTVAGSLVLGVFSGWNHEPSEARLIFSPLPRSPGISRPDCRRGEGKDFTTSPVTVDGARDAFRQPSLRLERLSCRVAPNKTGELASFHTCNGVADVGS